MSLLQDPTTPEASSGSNSQCMVGAILEVQCLWNTANGAHTNPAGATRWFQCGYQSRCQSRKRSHAASPSHTWPPPSNATAPKLVWKHSQAYHSSCTQTLPRVIQLISATHHGGAAPLREGDTGQPHQGCSEEWLRVASFSCTWPLPRCQSYKRLHVATSQISPCAAAAPKPVQEAAACGQLPNVSQLISIACPQRFDHQGQSRKQL